MDTSQLTPLLDFLQQHPEWLAIIILVAALLESLAFVGILIPGVLLMFVLSSLAGSGLLSLEMTLLTAVVGAVLGDGISFYLGRAFHDKLHGIWPFRRYPGILRRGETFFYRHGGKSIVIGRFVGPVRPVIPVVAGMFDMKSRQFFLYNVVSALLWAPVYMLPGFLVGASIRVDVELPAHFYVVFFATLAILLATFFLFFNLHWQLQPESRVYQWLQQRVHRSLWSRSWWLRLSSPRSGHQEFPLPSLMLLIFSLLFFILLTVAVLETRILGVWNQGTHEFFQSLRQPLLDPLFISITLIGDVSPLYILFIAFGGFLALRRHYAAALHVAVAGLFTAGSVTLLKLALSVGRPDAIHETMNSFAFPSGHSSGAMVFWGLLAAFVAQEARHKKRWQIYSLMALPPLLIALSRLYLGVHWLTDVLGGLLWGLAICALTRISFSPFDRHPITLGRLGIAMAILAGAGVLGYVIWYYPEAVATYSHSTS